MYTNKNWKGKEFRHPLNNNLLFEAGGKGQVEIVDRKTRAIMYLGPSRAHNDIGPKGAEFQSMSRDMTCPSCKRLLCRAIGTTLHVSIKCTHCKEVHLFSVKELYNKSFKTLPLRVQESLNNRIKSLTF